MKSLALAVVALSVVASAGHAEEFRTSQGRAASTPGAITVASRAAAPIGRDGQNASHRCSTENPNIEYRDCVNASTRDPNAKVRMG
ncbi:MAG: hypothetical protein ACXU82_04430 [Caulobacteraceae bacterium]